MSGRAASKRYVRSFGRGGGALLSCAHNEKPRWSGDVRGGVSQVARPTRVVSADSDTAAFSPFRIRSFRYQWPGDMATSWAFEMETIILSCTCLSRRSRSRCWRFSLPWIHGHVRRPAPWRDRRPHRPSFAAVRDAGRLRGAGHHAHDPDADGRRHALVRIHHRGTQRVGAPDGRRGACVRGRRHHAGGATDGGDGIQRTTQDSARMRAPSQARVLLQRSAWAPPIRSSRCFMQRVSF